MRVQFLEDPAAKSSSNFFTSICDILTIDAENWVKTDEK